MTDENFRGYSDAAYNLTIKAHTVQATEDAVKAVFGEEALQHASDENLGLGTSEISTLARNLTG